MQKSSTDADAKTIAKSTEEVHQAMKMGIIMVVVSFSEMCIPIWGKKIQFDSDDYFSDGLKPKPGALGFCIFLFSC